MSLNNGKYTTIRWHNSLIVRVIGLCVILVLCLLGSVYILTGHYYGEVVRQMEVEAASIAEEFQIWLKDHPKADLEAQEIPDDLRALNKGEAWEFRFVPEAEERGRLTPQLTEDGYVFEATEFFQWGDRWVELRFQLPVNPQTEIVRAFKNRYLLALTLGFFLTLGLMVYVIAKTLRPLKELSQTCAEISEGNLKDVTIRGNTGEVLALEQTFNRMVDSLREKETVEANLRQAQRLSAIGNLAAGVAHDVRNPLNAIKLVSSHALDTLKDTPDSGHAMKQLRTIRSEVNRLEDIVSGFLSLAKEEELKLQPQQIDVLLEECARLVRKDAEARDVRLIRELRAGETTLLLDPKQFTRAVLNVLLNALEVCPAGGRVRLFSRLTYETCEVEIRDDGPGMPKEVMEHAFDPYFTTKTTGTGLGLSITRGIIEEHGGSVSLTSTEGHGCQVLLTLPLPDPAEIRAASDQGRGDNQEGARKHSA